MRMSLGEVCTARSSVVDPTFAEYRHLPHVAPDSIERNTGRLLQIRSAAEDGVTSGKYRFEPNDVLYSKIRPSLNKVAHIDFAGLCSADMYALNVDTNIATPGFIAHLLRSWVFLDYATSLSDRASIPKLNRVQLYGFEFELPALDKQRRIAAILDRTEFVRIKRRQFFAHFNALAKSLFHALVMESSCSPTSLGEAIEVRSSLVDPTAEIYQTLPHVGPDSIQSDSGRIGGWRTIAEDGVTSGKYEFRAGDVLYSKIRPNLNKVAIAPFNGLCSADMYAIRARDGIATPEFVEFTLRSPQFLAYASKLSNRASIPKLNRGQLVAFAAHLPPLPVQRQFSEKINALRVRTKGVELAMMREDELFASLQARAFRGGL